MIRHTSRVLILLCAFVMATAALAQWSGDPMQNLAVAVKTNDQVQPKVGTLPDGSAYVSWFDNETGGYDVYLQYFDGKGYAQWSTGGILIADRNYSSTTDYGFTVDGAGNALLAFNDDRSGNDQITVTKVSPAGVQLWGPTGVQASSGTAPKYAPDVAVTSDGGIAVGWTGGGKKGVDTVYAAKLDANGSMLWDVALGSAKGYDYAFSHLAPADNGSVIVLMVRTAVKSLGTGNRGLFAQKYSAKGRPAWGKGVVVLDNASLQGGEFPDIVSDGAGGAVMAWYTTGGESYVQHLDASGLELFPHNGLAAATNGDSRTEPSFTFDAASGTTTMVYNETFLATGNGIGGQRFSSAGVRLWTNDGVTIRPGDYSVSTAWPTVVTTPSGPLVTWIEIAYPDSQIYGARLDGTGTITCPGINVSLAPGSKNRIAAVSTPEGGGIFAWEDGRSDFSDIYAQRLGADCTLGLVP